MKVTIDRAGRVVVPKALRDELGLTAGTSVEAAVVDGRLVFTPWSPRIRVETGPDGLPVFVADEPMPPLTAEDVREVLERVRR